MGSSCKKCGLTCCMHPVEGMVCTCKLQPYRPTTTDRLAAIVKAIVPEWFTPFHERDYASRIYPAAWQLHHIEFHRCWMLSINAYNAQQIADDMRKKIESDGPAPGDALLYLDDGGEIFFRCSTADAFELLVMGTPQTA